MIVFIPLGLLIILILQGTAEYFHTKRCIKYGYRLGQDGGGYD